MRSDRRGEPHRHVALVTGGRGTTKVGAAMRETRAAASRVSLLRLSLAARLLFVAAAAALLWGAVLWALR